MNDIFTFDQFPNEIYYHLFSYFNIYELYRTFSRINNYFDTLIKNYHSLQFIVNSIEDFDHPIHRHYLPHIQTLIINHSKLFFDSQKHHLSSVRCLILCRPSRDQWDAIQPEHFPSLQRLFLINSTFVYRTEQFCQLIFSNQFPLLYTCAIPFIAYEDNNQWNLSPKLRSIEMKIWDLRIYQQILNACPNLIRLKMDLSGTNKQEQLSEEIQHRQLQYLAFQTSHCLTCKHIDSILFFVPNLRHFALKTTHRQQSSLSLDQLTDIFLKRIPKLTRLNLDIRIPEDHFLFNSYQD